MQAIECSKCKYPEMTMLDVEQRFGHAAAAFVCPACDMLQFVGEPTDLFIQAMEGEVEKNRRSINTTGASRPRI